MHTTLLTSDCLFCVHRSRASALADLQLRLMQLGLRWNVTTNTMTQIFTVVGQSLRQLGVLAFKPADQDAEYLLPVEGDDCGPSPSRM